MPAFRTLTFLLHLAAALPVSATIAASAHASPLSFEDQQRAMLILSGWAGDYLSDSGGRVTLKHSGRTLHGGPTPGSEGFVHEMLQLSLAGRQEFRGIWNNGTTSSALVADATQPPGALAMRRVEGESRPPYRLCRAVAADARLDHAGNGMWAELVRATAVPLPSGGNDLLFQVRVKRVGPAGNLDPASFGAALAGDAGEVRAAGYFDPSTGRSAGAQAVGECGDLVVNFRFAGVAGKVRRLTPISGASAGRGWDVSTLVAAPEANQGPASPVPTALLAKYEGDWKTQPGTMRIARQGSGAALTMLGASNQVLFTSSLVPSTDGKSLEGTAQDYPDPGPQRFRLVLTPDGADFDAWKLGPDGRQGLVIFNGWSEARRAANANPPPSAPGPVVTPPVPPVATPSTPTQPAPSPVPSAGAFRSLNRLDVRLDRVVEARGYSNRQVHAFVTVRNASLAPQYFTSGFLKAVLADTDGVAQERSQPYRASGEPAILFGSTPVVQPGGQLAIRYVFTPDDGSTPATLTLSDGAKVTDFAINGL